MDDVRLSALRRTLWILVGIAAVTFAGMKLVAKIDEGQGSNPSASVARAAFELTDHRGRIRTERDFPGRWLLIFFGFTNCPDVCPTTLAEVAAVMEGLGSTADKVQPVFITIDPERDTPASLGEYVSHFEADIVGLTGTPKQIADSSKTFPIFYERIEAAAAPDGYTMAHTSHLFLFDPDASFAASWPYGTPAEEILADLRERI